MLSFIRKYRIYFLILFFICGLALVVSFGLPGSSGLGGGGASSAVAGRIGDQIVSADELTREINARYEQAQRLFGAQLQGAGNQDWIQSLIRSQVAPNRVLDSLMQEKFLIFQAQEMGLKASPSAIRGTIEKEPYFQKNGSFDPLLYRERVTQPGDFEKRIGQQILRNSVVKAVSLGMGIESSYEEELDAKLSEKRYFEVLRVNPSAFKSEVNVTNEDVEKFLQEPESKIQLEDYYNRNIGQYKKEEEVKASHILIRESEGLNAQEKIQEIHKEIQEKKMSFAEAAKKYSQDKANASKGGDLGFFARGRMAPEFEKAAFELKNLEDVSEPVKTSFGWHLVKLIDRKAAEEKRLEDVRLEIAPEVLKEEMAASKAKAYAEKLAETKSAPSDSEAKKYNFTWQNLGSWTPLLEQLGNFGPDLVSTSELVSLNSDNRYLPKALKQGTSYNVVRWKEKPSEDKANPDPQNIGVAPKAQESFEFFFDAGMKDLEDRKKVFRSEEILSQLNQQLQQSR